MVRNQCYRSRHPYGEWASGNQISAVPHVGTHATPERYKRAVTQNIANPAIEIAIAQLYPDAEPGKINRPQLIGAKDLVDRKEDVHVKALKILSKTTDILDYDANSIFGVTRAIKWNGEESTSELRAMVRNWLAANGIYENGERSKGYPEWEEDPRAGRQSNVVEQSHEDLTETKQPEIAKVSAGMYSIEGLMASPAPKATTKRPPAMCRWKRLSRSKTKLIIRYRQAKALMQMLKNRCRKRTQNFN